MAAPQLRLVVSESGVSVANNTSLVTAKLEIYGNGETQTALTVNGTITINGVKHNVKADGFTTAKKWQYLASASETVKHNEDGSKSIKVSGTLDTSWSYYGAISTSKTVKLTTIARATVPDAPATGIIGSPVTINLPRKSTRFTHTVWYCLPGQDWVNVTNSAEGSYTLTIPLEDCRYITNSTSGECKISVNTYDGPIADKKKIGRKETSFIAKVPDSVVPNITGIKITEGTPVVASYFTKYLQTLSKFNVAITASGIYGSNIKTCKTVIEGVNYSGQNFTSNTIIEAGRIPVTITITDSRGRTAQQTAYINVAEYFRPRIDNVSVIQCNADGSPNTSGDCTKVRFSGAVAPVDNQNTKALTIKWRKLTDASYKTYSHEIGWNFDDYVIFTGTIPDESYEFIVRAADMFYSTEQKAGNGKTIMTLKAGGDSLIIHGNEIIEGSAVIDNDLTVDGMLKIPNAGVFNQTSYFRIGDLMICFGQTSIKPSAEKKNKAEWVDFPVTYKSVPEIFITNVGHPEATILLLSIGAAELTRFELNIFSTSLTTRDVNWLSIGKA